MISFAGRHFERGIILQAVRWYLAYALSYRDVEELMLERGVEVSHSTVNRWVRCYAAQLSDKFESRKRPVGRRWRMDETYVKVRGQWKYLYRAVDQNGLTVDFLLRARRDRTCQSAFKWDPFLACKRDPSFWLIRVQREQAPPRGFARWRRRLRTQRSDDGCGSWGYSDQAASRFLKRQDSLPVSMMSQ